MPIDSDINIQLNNYNNEDHNKNDIINKWTIKIIVFMIGH